MKLENINFKYKKQNELLLDNISLYLHPEKLNIIIGTNGAGKTTLLDVISGLHTLEAFTPPFQSKEIVYQLQGIHLPPILKGKDLLRLILKSNAPLIPFSALESQLINLLSDRERKMLERLQDVTFGDMSMGERTWLIIRCLTTLNRKLYIFDEPTAGVDPASRPLIIEALEQLASKKDTFVVMSTHILHELAHVNCEINFLHQGKIAFTGSYQSFLEENRADHPDQAFRNFLDREYVRNEELYK